MKKGLTLITALAVLMTLGFTSMDVAYAQGSIAGVVIDQEGAQVAGAHVVISSAVRERGVRPYHDRAETGEDGTFNFIDVPAGSYLINAGFMDVGRVREQIEVQDGQELNIQLQLLVCEQEEIETGSVSGVVIDADGNPVEGARVGIQRRAILGRHVRNIRLHTETDANGMFSIEGVPIGNHRIVAGAPRLGNAEAQIDVEVDQNTEVELQLAGRGNNDDNGRGGDRGGNRGGRGGGPR